MDFVAWNATVDAIFAAAASPSQWPETLQSIANLFDARGALLLYKHLDGRFGLITSPTLVMMAREYDEHWQRLDVRADRVFDALATGHRDVQADHTFFTEEEVAGLPIYQQFLLPHGIGWGMTVPVSPSPAVSVILTLLRARDKPGYTETLQEQFLALSRHVERSLSLSIRLIDAEAEQLGLSQALDRVSCGVFGLDRLQRVLFANRTAREICGNGILMSSGRLVLHNEAARRTLSGWLAEIEAGTTKGTVTFPSLIVPNGDHSLIVQVIPLQVPIDVPDLQSASAIVLVTDQKNDRPFDPAVVRDLFKLTLGEARLAALVGAGVGPVEAASALGIKENTARYVLKNVFSKMGISRQSEMAALMGKLFMLRQTKH